ncbi:nicotinate phosphoribosyltransferase [Pseudonocardia acidicola]|uniref:Nicotinate phosphoribosyltransferase n=1 Tax=Pseudonocardia acidicola TaxID=2724939 RepID=A0ABX1S877_9PSEU|nr:nicotinate phosphoribosyltransferase [Pseudonocardia acidicola]NMH97764.1 nicotinate phosphoribosyltransferase [Pseudonocardia acidicola]
MPESTPTRTRSRGDAAVTDLYEITMALAYLHEGVTEPATFSLFTRELPAERGFLVAAGLTDVIDFLADFVITDDDLAVFAAALGVPVADVARLGGTRFTGDVWAVPEGRVVLAGEPLLELTAPLPQAQLMETWVLNQISHQTTLASKAARSVLAARGRPVVDFSLRRTHGVEAGMHAARAGAIVGFAATSNVAAAHAYGLRATGTMAHSFVLAFPTETTSFEAFARSTTGPVTLLVDTYDTEQGVHRAVEVLRRLPADRDIGVRLDSGDLGALAVRARRILDAAGLARARIVVSGGLDEYGVEDLLAAGAPVDVFAVGTKVGTAADSPYLDAAYKLVEYAGRPVMKLSTGKATAPGAKQVFRGPGCADVLALRNEEAPPGTQPLLEQVLRAGLLLRPRDAPADEVAIARRRFAADLAELPAATRTVRSPRGLHPVCSPQLQALTEQVQQRLATGELGAAGRHDRV